MPTVIHRDPSQTHDATMIQPAGIPRPTDGPGGTPTGVPPSGNGAHPARAWNLPPAKQLQRYDRSIREPQRLALILRLLGPLQDKRCLLVSCGGGTGGLSFHLRAEGGTWSWADLHPEHAGGVAPLLAEPVTVVRAGELPYPDHTFDRVVVLELHHAGESASTLVGEVRRVLTPGGRTAIVAAHPNPRLPFRLLEPLLPGSATEKSDPDGPLGLSLSSMVAMVRDHGLIPEARGACSRFFSELVEWAHKRNDPAVPGNHRESDGEPAARVHPLGRLVASLDYLIPGSSGYTLAVSSRRPPLLRPQALRRQSTLSPKSRKRDRLRRDLPPHTQPPSGG